MPSHTQNKTWMADLGQVQRTAATRHRPPPLTDAVRHPDRSTPSDFDPLSYWSTFDFLRNSPCILPKSTCTVLQFKIIYKIALFLSVSPLGSSKMKPAVQPFLLTYLTPEFYIYLCISPKFSSIIPYNFQIYRK